MHRIVLAAFLVLGLVACEESPDTEGAFFDPEALEEGSAELGEDFSVVPCEGAEDLQRWEWHPRLVRGQVLAPQGDLGGPASGLLDWLIPSAHAVPLEGESTVADAPIRLIRGDETTATTTTDALGRFCLVIPEGERLGPTWRLEAGEAVVLRRVLLDPVEADVSVHTEAAYRLATRDRDAGDLEPHTWRNILTVSATVLDLTNPLKITPATTTAEAVREATARLESSQRMKSLLSK